MSMQRLKTRIRKACTVFCTSFKQIDIEVCVVACNATAHKSWCGWVSRRSFLQPITCLETKDALVKASWATLYEHSKWRANNKSSGM